MPKTAAPADPPLALLGGLPASTFLREYWQRKPLLVRQAIPQFAGLTDWKTLRGLCARDDSQARLIVRAGRQWSLRHGPFTARDWKAMHEDQPWTVLLQDLNVHLPEADALLRRFAFVPHARIDDLMVSHACAGGGVGAHVDSYDVFLLQGPGRRRWRISGQQDLTLRPGLPLRILKRFVPEQTFVLEPGDMLYLPPHYAHEGTALETCQTYSIGFRAPNARDWLAEFLMDYAERIPADTPLIAPYRDPDPGLPVHAGELPARLQTHLQQALQALRFDPAAIEDFNGRYLTEPKPHLVFSPPDDPLTPAAFRRAAQRHGVCLDPRTRLLFGGARAWCNGEPYALADDEAAAVRCLADVRALSGAELTQGAAAPGADWTRTLWPMLHLWYEDGWLQLATPHATAA